MGAFRGYDNTKQLQYDRPERTAAIHPSQRMRTMFIANPALEASKNQLSYSTKQMEDDRFDYLRGVHCVDLISSKNNRLLIYPVNY